MKLMKIALCGVAASLAMAGAASAQLSFNAGASSEYVFRGLSQGDGTQYFGGVDWSQDAFYVGAWASNVGFGPTAEVDFYAGYAPSVGGMDLDFSAIYYGYVNDDNTYVDYNTGLADPSIKSAYTEFAAAATLPLGEGSLSGKVVYSPDFFAEAGNAIYYELGFDYPLAGVSINGAYGMQSVSDTESPAFADSYDTWNLGMTAPLSERFSFDVRYTSTDDDANIFANSNLAGVAFDGVTATISMTFP